MKAAEKQPFFLYYHEMTHVLIFRLKISLKQSTDTYNATAKNNIIYNNVIIRINQGGYCFKASERSFSSAGTTDHLAQLQMDNN